LVLSTCGSSIKGVPTEKKEETKGAIFEQRKEVFSYLGNCTNFLTKKNKYLEPLDVLAKRKKSPARLTKASKIYKTIIRAIQDKKGENIVSLDLRKIPEAVADFFIICEASNQPQIRAISDSVEEEVKKAVGEIPYRHEGKQNLQWVLIDYINVVVHIMTPESRKFYKLEEMWSDAPHDEHAQ
jgi:ribosome-associated protein